MGIRPRDILLHTQVPARPGLYVLGVFDKRVTVYSQQVRALNLVYSLAQSQLIKRGTKVMIIGAGVSGLTAAVAAANCCGAQVTILEKSSAPLALFGQGSRRWLHPHIYEWPREDPALPHPLDPNAHLPLMNWEADTVEHVRKRLLEQYTQFEKEFGIDLRVHVSDLRILEGSDHLFSLDWSQPIDKTYTAAGRRTYTRQCDIIILAVGFGMERKFAEVPLISYWSSDKLDEEDVSLDGRPRRILVSGTGDGGLIDLLRARFKSFSHQNVVERLTNELLDESALNELTVRLQAIEDAAEQAAAQQKPYEARLNEDYQKLGAELKSKVDFASKIGIRSDTQAVLTSNDKYPLSLRTSILNRLLCVLVPDFYYLRGPWKCQRDENGIYEVTFTDGEIAVFDEIIIRHGPEAALKKTFPDVWEACAPLIARAELDQTRYPIYSAFFDKCMPSVAAETQPGMAAGFPNPPATAPVVTPSAAITATLSNIPPVTDATESPFKVVGGLAAGDPTYLRRECDEQLERALESRSLIAIDGEFQIGKSSLLNRIEVRPHRGWKLCRFDLQGMRTDNLQAFVREFFEEMSREIGPISTWQDLFKYVKEQPLMLLFDEFGALNDMDAGAISLISKLTKLGETHPGSVRVVVCLPMLMSHFVKQHNGNPKLWKPWHAVTVNPLEREDEMMAIFDLLPTATAAVARRHSPSIWQQSSGHPHRLQALCDSLFRAASRGESEEYLISLINNAESYVV